jgi:hypothetical protein
MQKSTLIINSGKLPKIGTPEHISELLSVKDVSGTVTFPTCAWPGHNAYSAPWFF